MPTYAPGGYLNPANRRPNPNPTPVDYNPGGPGGPVTVGYDPNGVAVATQGGQPVASQPTPPTGGGGPTTPPTGPTAAQQDAIAIIDGLLAQYGLSSLDQWAWGLITQGAGASQVELELQQRPEFKARFPGIELRQKAGLPPISAAQYLAYEDQAAALFNQAGLPKGFYDTTDHLANFIGQDISITELGERVKQGYQAAMQAPAEYRQALNDLYGVDSGHLAAFFLDPAQAEPLIMQKFTAAKIAGEGLLTGYGELGVTPAEQLAAQGVTEQAARQGLSALAKQGQLFQALPGTAETAIGQDVQLGAEFGGNAADQQAIEQRASQRVAAFQGGGDFAGGAHGLTGLGAAANA